MTQQDRTAAERVSILLELAPTGSRDSIRLAAKSAREGIAREIAELQRALDVVDTVVKWKAPAMVVALPMTQASGSAEVTVRRERIGSIALELAGDSRGRVDTDAVFTRLREEGDQTPERDLKIAIGNVLTRAGWSRVATGIYEPPEEGPNE